MVAPELSFSLKLSWIIQTGKSHVFTRFFFYEWWIEFFLGGSLPWHRRVWVWNGWPWWTGSDHWWAWCLLFVQRLIHWISKTAARLNRARAQTDKYNMQSHSDAVFNEDPFSFLRQDLCWTLSLRWEKITVIFCTRCRVDGLKIISRALNDSQFGAPNPPIGPAARTKWQKAWCHGFATVVLSFFWLNTVSPEMAVILSLKPRKGWVYEGQYRRIQHSCWRAKRFFSGLGLGYQQSFPWVRCWQFTYFFIEVPHLQAWGSWTMLHWRAWRAKSEIGRLPVHAESDSFRVWKDVGFQLNHFQLVRYLLMILLYNLQPFMT